ncbi:MAG: uroporphyrinogen decarboxylase/cobalamine-independent methonine synthase family protein, partial [Planctomycetota bacterium]
MAKDMEQLYKERLKRYVTAMRNEKPDRVPIRPFVAEFTAKYAGYTCQEVTHDYEKAFAAARRCAADFDWDAVVGNMVYVWTGLTQAIGMKYYAVPGIDLATDIGFQYIEPPEEEAFMKPDEYDQLIEDPTGFLFNVWLPRVSADVSAMGGPTSYRNNLSFLKGGMAMLNYFNAFGRQAALLRSESGTVSAISGILKAPFDILADKLRGYIGLTVDLFERPEKVLAACEALMPHLTHVALSGADPEKNVPVGLWMHRGCVPFVSRRHFEKFYWPTLKPIIEEIWSHGHQVLFYAEGNWDV